MDKDVGDEELVPLDEDMPEDLQELSPSCIVSAVGQCAELQQQPGAALRTRLRPSACTSAAFADNGKWRNPQCKKHADRCGRWVNGSITNLQLAGYPALLAACLLSSSIARVQGQNTMAVKGETPWQ